MDRHQRIERALRTNVKLNRALLASVSEAEFLSEACRLAVEETGYRLAWVGYAEGDPQKTVRPVAQHGFDDGYVDRLNISWGENERGSGPTGLAIRTGRPQFAQNITTDERFAPWRADALRRGYAASAALPLRDGGVTFGALNLYASEPDAFDADEIELLTLLADDLAHGVLCARGKKTLAVFQRRLDLVNRLDTVGRTAAAIAHDINNSLTVAMICLSRLEANPVGANRALIADAISGLQQATALNRRLFEVARPPPDACVFSVDAQLERLIPPLARAFAPDVGVALECGAAGGKVQMAQVSFDQVISNLVLNARDASASGGTICIRSREVVLGPPLDVAHVGMPSGSYVAVEVTDTGHGIAPEVLEQLFEPFFTTKGIQGTGIGLTTALSLVRQAGGRLSVSSVVGRGTTFEVLLPAVAPAPA